MKDDSVYTLVASSTKGRYAPRDPETGHDLTSVEPIAILLGGQWIEGHIEHSRQRYESRAPGLPTHLAGLLLHCPRRRDLRLVRWDANPTHLCQEEMMPERGETAVLALLSPTRKLAQLLAGAGASLIETHLSSKGLPPGLSSHCSRETRLAQVYAQGDSRHATPSLPA